MKKLCMFFTAFILSQFGVQAQTDVDRKAEIEKIKIAYFTRKLDLSVDEAQQFWPVFNNYEVDIKTSIKGLENDEIRKNEAILAVQKRFKPTFQKVLKTDSRANNVFVAHRDFITQLNKLRNRIKDRREGANPPQRNPRRGGKRI